MPSSWEIYVSRLCHRVHSNFPSASPVVSLVPAGTRLAPWCGMGWWRCGMGWWRCGCMKSRILHIDGAHTEHKLLVYLYRTATCIYKNVKIHTLSPLHGLQQDNDPDMSFFAPDCFHMSVKGHRALAAGLWNNMVSTNSAPCSSHSTLALFASILCRSQDPVRRRKHGTHTTLC